MRKILNIVAGYGIDVSDQIDLNGIKINKLWTIYDEKELWKCYPKFDTQTGEKLPKREIELEDLYLQHHRGLFIEDIGHDWKVINGKLDYYSRVVKQGKEVKILIEYDKIE
jgi:hypothetical protein